MKLYTVEITFADFTFGVEQYKAESPESALEEFFTNAECLNDYDRKKLIAIVKNRIKNKNALIHVAGNMRGVWIINVGTEDLELPEEVEPIFGGRIVQTDPDGPMRGKW